VTESGYVQILRDLFPWFFLLSVFVEYFIYRLNVAVE
jgi:hypothetical protein